MINHSTERVHIFNADCLDVLRLIGDNFVDALVTDPPAGIGFMGKDWDDYRRTHNEADVGRDNVFGRASRVAPEIGRAREGFLLAMQPIFAECFRVMKPGAHGLVWALPRTSHWTATALEEGGFEIRDRISHLFGSGFPKSHDISKAIDKAAGAKREVRGKNPNHHEPDIDHHERRNNAVLSPDVTAPATALAKQWDGWGTALKPACQDWWLIRKPLIGTVAENVTAFGVGGLNIDASRIAPTQSERETLDNRSGDTAAESQVYAEGSGQEPGTTWQSNSAGRWPANVVLSHNDDCAEACTEGCAVAALDAQTGTLKSGTVTKTYDQIVRTSPSLGNKRRMLDPSKVFSDSGGASRFFYVAKAPKKDKTANGVVLGVLRCGCSGKAFIEWAKEDQKQTAQMAITSLEKVISDLPLETDDRQYSRIDLCGKLSTAPSLPDFTSTTATKTNSTTESKTSGSSLLSSTSEATPGVNCAVTSGGNLAGSAESSKPATLKTFTLPSTGGLYTGDVVSATAQKLLPVMCPACKQELRIEAHPTVKNTELMKYLIKLITPPGGIVLDPFMGSGSTGVACMRLELALKFIGVEQDADFYKTSLERLKIELPAQAFVEGA